MRAREREREYEGALCERDFRQRLFRERALWYVPALPGERERERERFSARASRGRLCARVQNWIFARVSRLFRKRDLELCARRHARPSSGLARKVPDRTLLTQNAFPKSERRARLVEVWEFWKKDTGTLFSSLIFRLETGPETALLGRVLERGGHGALPRFGSFRSVGIPLKSMNSVEKRVARVFRARSPTRSEFENVSAVRIGEAGNVPFDVLE